MIYSFKCECGERWQCNRSIKVGPPTKVECPDCSRKMDRDWKADMPFIDTSNCRDANDIPVEKRVASAYDQGSPELVEKQFKDQIQKRRAEIRDAGGQRGSRKQTHSVPAHLFHGKIKETGDKNYWQDPKNLQKHKSCKVD